MKKFENLTSNENEKSTKIGNNVPAKAAGIAWFSSKKINPKNNVSVVDLSTTIQENKTIETETSGSILAYADELGFLKKIDGNYNFQSNNLTIGNVFLNKSTNTERLNISDIDPNDFVHYIYMSRYFINGPANLSLISLKQFVPEDSIKGLNIRVLNADNSEYINTSSNTKKYRILLEPFRTTNNASSNEWPYRIIVLLDSTSPTNLKLVYDKVECDDNANVFNQVLNYTETVNAVPYFSEIPEESFVIDNNYKDKNNFSIKKIDDKYRTLISEINKESGYQIITPSKAINDYRTFEVFNWRMIARTKNNVNLDQLNYGQNIDESGNISQRVVKIGVLYSPTNQPDNSSINPYIFYRLENSPFNLSKYKFINPNPAATKAFADYWKVNIDEIDNLDDYDVLAWSPSFTLTADQTMKLREFLRKNGTLILDLHDGLCDARSLNTQLSLSAATISSNYKEMKEDNVILDPTKNGGWSIVDGIFEKDYYGIFGSNYSYRSNTYKQYKYFDNTIESNSFLNFGLNSSSKQPTGIVLGYPNSGDSLSRGNVIATSFPLLPYCNSIYSLSSPEQAADSNYGLVYDEDPSGTYSGIVEGPFKLLYNIISYALYCKAQASRNIDIRNSLYNFVTPWDSSWAMDSDALFDEEKQQYFTAVSISASESRYARDILKLSSSTFDFYKTALSAFLPPIQREIVNRINSSNVEIFIEVTNPDIIISNAQAISPEDFESNENIPSSYYLYKVTNPDVKCFAYTNKVSPKLVVPSNFGSYAVIEKPFSSSNTRRLNNELNVLNSFKSYPFNLTSKYNYARATDKPLSFNVTVDTQLTATFTALLKEQTKIVVNPTKETGQPVKVQANCIEIKSAIDDLQLLRTTSSSNANNVFPYTGDIDIHRNTRIWYASGDDKKDDEVAPLVLSDEDIAQLLAAGATLGIDYGTVVFGSNNSKPSTTVVPADRYDRPVPTGAAPTTSTVPPTRPPTSTTPANTVPATVPPTTLPPAPSTTIARPTTSTLPPTVVGPSRLRDSVDNWRFDRMQFNEQRNGTMKVRIHIFIYANKKVYRQVHKLVGLNYSFVEESSYTIAEILKITDATRFSQLFGGSESDYQFFYNKFKAYK